MSPATLALALLSAAPSAEFVVEVSTSGGFTGRGVGGYRISGDGAASVQLMGGKKCDGRATGPALAKLAEAVKAASPSRWKPHYAQEKNPDGCCDQIRTSLALTLRAEGKESRHATGWFDDSRELAPSDLDAIAEAAEAIADELRKGCKR